MSFCKKVLMPKTDIWQAFYKIWNSRNTVETKKGGFIKQFFERNDGYHFDGRQPSVFCIAKYINEQV